MVFCRSGQLYKTDFKYLDFTASIVQNASLELTNSSSVFNMAPKKKKDKKEEKDKSHVCIIHFPQFKQQKVQCLNKKQLLIKTNI